MAVSTTSGYRFPQRSAITTSGCLVEWAIGNRGARGHVEIDISNLRPVEPNDSNPKIFSAKSD